MGRYDKHDFSDSVSELSHDDYSTRSGTSKSSGLRNRLRRFGRKRGTSDGTASVGSRSRSRTSAAPAARAGKAGGAAASTTSSAASSAAAARRGGNKPDEARLTKEARTRFNMGLVYLKTGDYAKARENLEHSLYSHVRLAGNDSSTYGNDAILSVAGVREKLGDCGAADDDGAVVSAEERGWAVRHYAEARRLLRSVDPEDAPPAITEMLHRVEEKMARPEMRRAAATKPPAPTTTRYRTEADDGAKDLPGTGARSASPQDRGTPFDRIGGGFEKGFGKLHQFAQNVKEGIEEVAENVHDGIEHVAEDLGIKEDSSDDGSYRSSRSHHRQFRPAMAQLERENHRTALKTLQSLKEGSAMDGERFRRGMAESLLRVAESAAEANKVRVAADAYEESYAILALLDGAADGERRRLALKGCIRSHKQVAAELEGAGDHADAIKSRTRVCQLLDENNRTIPACEQRIIIAHRRTMRGEFGECSVVLSDAIRRLKKGVTSVDAMASDRRDLLIRCHRMQAICCAKSKKWKEALEQCDEVLPLIEKREGQGGKEYNSALIHKSALLVTTKTHRLAASLAKKYLILAELSDPDLIVDSVDHLLALDTFAATQLKLGNVDEAIPIFEQKLAFIKTLPDSPGNKQIKSDTMHKLGCLLANKNKPKKALSLLNQALSTKKHVHDGKHKSVLETTWAVAATNQSLGENGKALEEYTVLLDKAATVEDVPVDAVVVRYSAGKLFFQEGKVDKAVQSFREALKGAETSGNLELKSEITLNLANALSAQGEEEDAMDLYDQLLNTKSLKKTRIAFLTRFNKSLLLIKRGEVEDAKRSLNKIAGNRSSVAKSMKGGIFLTLGNLAISDGDIDRALEYFRKSLEVVGDNDLGALVDAKRSIAMAELEAGKMDDAISTLEDVLGDISNTKKKGKSTNLLKAEIWNSMTRVYKQKGELAEAKNFSKLALQVYKTELGETNPITLRNRSNLQLLLLEESEGLEKAEAKPIVSAAEFELEETLEGFISLDDPWTHRFDVASLKTNLGFIAIWRGKPKKARKLLRQVEEIELPPGHPLEHRITVLGERVEEMEKIKKKKS